MIGPAALTVLTALFSSAFVHAQSDNTLGIEAIEAHFSNAGITPSLLSTFDPSALMDLSFGSKSDVAPGTPLTVDDVKATPNITLAPANSSITLNGATYTLAMVDAGTVGTDESQGQTRHWLLNDVKVSDNTVDISGSTAITAYAGPFPADGSGAHRYVVLLYNQPSSFKAPADPAPGSAVGTFDFASYVKDSGLGALVAATYFTVEQGTASASVSPTSAVVTSTLPAAKATGGSSSQPAATGSSGSGSKSGSSIVSPYIKAIMSVAALVAVVSAF